jgi:hypothetical protein
MTQEETLTAILEQLKALNAKLDKVNTTLEAILALTGNP